MCSQNSARLAPQRSDQAARYTRSAGRIIEKGWPGSLSFFLPVERHFDEWAVANHLLQVPAAPRSRDVRQDLSPLLLLVDDASRRGQIGADLALKVEGEVRIRLQVGEPAAAPG